MARDKDKSGKGKAPKGDKQTRKLQKRFEEMEAAIDDQFKSLVEDEGFSREELETLRWDYRADLMGDYELSDEQVQVLVAAKEAGVAPNFGGASAAAPTGEPGAAAAPAEYQRKSAVDMNLIDKYLDRHVERDSTSELAQMYKAAYGEDLHVPEKLSLVDLTYRTSGISEAGKVTKEDIFDLPQEKKEEAPAVEAAPAAPKESRVLKFATAYKRGVPDGPGFGEKLKWYNPGRLWTIPKRFCGGRVGRYYVLFLINLVLFFLLLIPRLILWPIGFVLRLLRRFVAPKVSDKVGSRVRSLQEKLAEPPKPAAPTTAAPSTQKPSN